VVVNHFGVYFVINEQKRDIIVEEEELEEEKCAVDEEHLF